MQEIFEKIKERLEANSVSGQYGNEYVESVFLNQAIESVNQVAEGYDKKDQCNDCAGCTVWKCDCANTREHAIDEFANFIHKKAKENNGSRLSSETRSWTHASIFDYVNEFREEQSINMDQSTAYCNDGWIPCSERLPEESLNSVIGWDEYKKRCCFVQYLGGRWILGNDIDSVKIIAWRPLPVPYQPKGE